MNGDERKADLLCAGEQVLSPYPVIPRAPQPCIIPVLAMGKLRFGNL